jgi:hypothetical protein
MWWHAPSRGAGCGLPCTSAGHPSRGTATLAATRAPHLGQRPRVFQTKVGMSGASAPGVAVGMRTVRAMAMLGEGGDPFVTLLRQQRAMERSLLDNMEQGPPLTASGSQRDTSTTLSRQLGDSGFAYTERGGTEGASDGCAPTPPSRVWVFSGTFQKWSLRACCSPPCGSPDAAAGSTAVSKLATARSSNFLHAPA